VRDPILRETKVGDRKIQALGGLHFIASNKVPYFSLTIASWVRGREDTFGAAHDQILEIWPELKPLADLHLSDINGVPMYAVENGWYWLAGAKSHGFNERFNGANGSMKRSPFECLSIFADHVRVDIPTAQAVLDMVSDLARDDGVKVAKAWFATWIENQKPRWKVEADAVIDSLGLVVFGDQWTPSLASVQSQP